MIAFQEYLEEQKEAHRQLNEAALWQDGDPERANLIAVAQVHATLAIAAAIAEDRTQ